MPKSLSLHPKLVVALEVLLSLIFLWWLKQITSWWIVGVWFLFRFVLWFWMVRVVYYPPEISRWRHFVSLNFFNIGMLLFLLFIEKPFAWAVTNFIFILIPAVSFWLLPSSQVGISPLLKPHRRWRWIMASVGVAGIFTGVGAIISFQITYNVGSWVWILISSILTTVVAGWWWWEYLNKEGVRPDGSQINIFKIPNFVRWLTVYFVIMAETQWVVFLLPLGYFVDGFILTWVWYVLWLLVRFHLSNEGIDWKKQKYFIASTLLILVIFLTFVVRWK